MNRIFLVEVFQKNKILFLFFLLFIVGQAFFMKIRIHNFPFYVFDMYSRPDEHRGGDKSIYQININDERLLIHQLSQYQQATVIGGWKYYHYLQQGNEDYWKKAAFKNFKFIPLDKNILLNNRENIEKQVVWLKLYLEKLVGATIKSLIVEKVDYTTNTNEEIIENNRQLIYKYTP